MITKTKTSKKDSIFFNVVVKTKFIIIYLSLEHFKINSTIIIVGLIKKITFKAKK
jgi:hypothetical protein